MSIAIPQETREERDRKLADDRRWREKVQPTVDLIEAEAQRLHWNANYRHPQHMIVWMRLPEVEREFWRNRAVGLQ